MPNPPRASASSMNRAARAFRGAILAVPASAARRRLQLWSDSFDHYPWPQCDTAVRSRPAVAASGAPASIKRSLRAIRDSHASISSWCSGNSKALWFAARTLETAGDGLSRLETRFTRRTPPARCAGEPWRLVAQARRGRQRGRRADASAPERLGRARSLYDSGGGCRGSLARLHRRTPLSCAPARTRRAGSGESPMSLRHVLLLSVVLFAARGSSRPVGKLS